jgi:tetratricopeptide (TPR) repeat protein
MDGNHYETAVAHFHHAVELDGKAWVALEGLARCAGDQQQYCDAISWQEKAIEALRPLPWEVSSVAGYLWPRIVDWADKIGDKAKAADAAEKGFEAEPYSISAQFQLLRKLFERDEFAEMISILKFMDSQTSNDQTYSWLVRFFIEDQSLFEEIGQACQKQGHPKFVLEAMDETLKVAGETDVSYQHVQLLFVIGYFCGAYYDMKEKAVVLWESFLERLSRKSEDSQKLFALKRIFTMNSLAQLYFDAAVEAWHSDVGSEMASADKLKGLAVSVTTGHDQDYQGFDFYTQDYPSLLWGRWLRDYRHAGEAAWRKCFRVRLLEEMNSIDDDDPTNDTDGLKALARSLTHAGDRRNAGAILAILFKPIENMIETNSSMEEKSTLFMSTVSQPVTSTAPRRNSIDQGHEGLPLHISEFSGNYYCDNCAHTAYQTEEMYFCEICYNINWCGDCLAQLKDPERRGSISQLLCNPKHDFYRAWPIPEEARYCAAQSFENGVIVRKVWLEKLRKEWWD